MNSLDKDPLHFLFLITFRLMYIDTDKLYMHAMSYIISKISYK